jgi:hypothetical protein
MTEEELIKLLEMEEYKDGVELICDTGYFNNDYVFLKYLKKEDYFIYRVNGEIVEGSWTNYGFSNFPSILNKPKKRTAYYKWRLWMKNGDIFEPAILINDNGLYGDGSDSIRWFQAVKREKISEALYRIEGQKGFND